MPSPVFEFFEMLAEELTLVQTRVLTQNDFDAEGDRWSILDELREELGVLTNEEAIHRSIELLDEHFRQRGSRLPFTYERKSGRFTAIDRDYLRFVTHIREIRGQGKSSRDFELTVMKR